MEVFRRNRKQLVILALCAVLLTAVSGRKLLRTPEGIGSPVEDCVVTPTGIDLRNRDLLLDVTVTLRGWDGKYPGVMAEVGEACTAAQLHETEEGVFTASLRLPLDPVSGFDLYLTELKVGQMLIQEPLRSWDHVAGLLPLRMTESQYSVPTYQDGTLEITRGPGAKLKGRDGNDIYTVDAPEFRSYRNGELVRAVPGKLNENVIGRDEPDGYIPETKENWDVPCEIGDEVLLTFACKDENGLGYEFVIVHFQVTGDGVEELCPEEDVDPRLTWSEE